MQFTNNEYKEGFRQGFEEHVFIAMELMHMPYSDVMAMPAGRLKKLIKWKNDLDKRKQEAIVAAKAGA